MTALDDILRELRLGTTAERLAAADRLSREASAADVSVLERIKRRELDYYVREAIEDAISRARTRTPATRVEEGDEPAEPDEASDSSLAAVRAAAVRETTGEIVHELNRLVGFVRAEARDEIDEFDSSRTAAATERLLSLIAAVDRLSKAAAVPVLSDFEIGSVLRDVAAGEAGRHAPCQVLAEGPDSLVVRSDPALLRLIMHNVVGNACEASLAIGDKEPPPVTISWGQTDTETWIRVLDRGVGLPEHVFPFEFGETTKDGHDGAGLTLVRQAADSLSARASLEDRSDGGAAFELRWETIVLD